MGFNLLRYILCRIFGLCAPPRPIRNLRAKLTTKGKNLMSTATLVWTVPTTRTDGTPLSAAEIDHQDIFDSAADNPNTPIGTVTGAGNTFTTGVLTTGTHNFTVTVTDTTGHTSAMSNTATVTVPVTLAAPSAVTDLAATLNS